jgi:hypothetical protein
LALLRARGRGGHGRWPVAIAIAIAVIDRDIDIASDARLIAGVPSSARAHARHFPAAAQGTGLARTPAAFRNRGPR